MGGAPSTLPHPLLVLALKDGFNKHSQETEAFCTTFLVACSRLSVVGNGEKRGRAREKNEGGLTRGSPRFSLARFFSSPTTENLEQAKRIQAVLAAPLGPASPRPRKRQQRLNTFLTS